MPDDSQPKPQAQSNDPTAFAQQQMRAYLNWMNSYQEMLRSAMNGDSLSEVGAKQWRTQMDYLKALTEASHIITKATGEYVQKVMVQSASALNEVTQAKGEGGKEHDPQ